MIAVYYLIRFLFDEPTFHLCGFGRYSRCMVKEITWHSIFLLQFISLWELQSEIGGSRLRFGLHYETMQRLEMQNDRRNRHILTLYMCILFCSIYMRCHTQKPSRNVFSLVVALKYQKYNHFSPIFLFINIIFDKLFLRGKQVRLF